MGSTRTKATHILPEAFDFLRGCHRALPFLFLTGDKFALIGREMAFGIFRDLEDGRVEIRPDGSSSEMIPLPENVLPEDSPAT